MRNTVVSTSTRRLRVGAFAALVTLAGAGLTACGSDSGSAADGGAIGVVASTNVWGDVAKSVGGDAVDVTSIISDPDQDPHSYEANATTSLAIKKAQVVIENGGGYDDFVEQLLDSNGSKAEVLDAVEISGQKAPAGGELNEHVWYDLPSVQKVATAIAEQLGKIDPSKADTFTANAQAFNTKVDALIADEAAAKKKDAGDGVGITEPVPLYLTAAMGLVNRTPEKFSEAIEEGDDVAPAVLKQTEELYSAKKVDVLVYNEQTSGPITERVLDAAKSAGVPVVGVTETMPAGLDYVGWMQKNIDAIAKALA